MICEYLGSYEVHVAGVEVAMMHTDVSRAHFRAWSREKYVESHDKFDIGVSGHGPLRVSLSGAAAK